jgi:hypothetical protein
MAVNPEISSGLPLQSVNRQPPPGSRTESYSSPATLGMWLRYHVEQELTYS